MLEGVHAVVATSGTVDGQTSFFGAVQGMTKIGHLGYRQLLQSSCGCTPGCRAQVGAVVPGQDESGPTKGVKGATKCAYIAWVLYLVQSQQ